MSVHDGHRDRMRKRIEENGISSLQEHEILEYLLYAFVPRKDTNEMAHNLLTEFGSLKEVFDASIERLQKVKGISYNMAIFLNSMSGISRQYVSNSGGDVVSINTVAKCVELMKPIMSSMVREEIHMLLRDSTGKLIKRVVVSKGVVNESSCYVRDITDIVLRNEASGIVLVHNHPSGRAKPSNADIQLTEQLYLAMTMIGVAFDDHLIIAKDNYYSFRQDFDLDRLKNGKISLSNGIIKDVEY